MARTTQPKPKRDRNRNPDPFERLLREQRVLKKRDMFRKLNEELRKRKRNPFDIPKKIK